MAPGVTVDDFFHSCSGLLRRIDFAGQQVPMRFIMSEKEHVRGFFNSIHPTLCLFAEESLWR